jgi:uncharacterized membrane protein
MEVLAFVTAAVTLVSFAYMAGLFISFSNTVMPAFDTAGGQHAAPAMQAINRTIINPFFLFSFVGSVLVGALTGVLLLVLDETTAAILFFVATGVYLVGNVGLTRAKNIPLNDELDRAEIPTDPARADKLWADFSVPWTRWNTVRAVVCAASVVLVAFAMYFWGG